MEHCGKPPQCDAGETLERGSLVEDVKPQKRGVVGSKISSLVKIVSMTSVPDFVERKSLLSQGLRANLGIRKADIHLTHLRKKIQENWDTKFSPCIIKSIRTLMPWAAPSSKEHHAICKILANVFPSEVRLEDSDSNLSVIVFKKINDTITAWQHKFSTTAEKYLMKSIFKQLKDDTQVWSKFCTWALATDLGKEDLQTQPEEGQQFYYWEYEEPHPDKPDLQIHVKLNNTWT
ncbi:hypothetical protein DXG01_005328 [Tephrocybe rancida]|nr:hypothetical protein DXG01_005328 [Tephrocybe rancida]